MSQELYLDYPMSHHRGPVTPQAHSFFASREEKERRLADILNIVRVAALNTTIRLLEMQLARDTPEPRPCKRRPRAPLRLGLCPRAMKGTIAEGEPIVEDEDAQLLSPIPLDMPQPASSPVPRSMSPDARAQRREEKSRADAPPPAPRPAHAQLPADKQSAEASGSKRAPRAAREPSHNSAKENLPLAPMPYINSNALWPWGTDLDMRERHLAWAAWQREKSMRKLAAVRARCAAAQADVARAIAAARALEADVEDARLREEDAYIALKGAERACARLRAQDRAAQPPRVQRKNFIVPLPAVSLAPAPASAGPTPGFVFDGENVRPGSEAFQMRPPPLVMSMPVPVHAAPAPAVPWLAAHLTASPVARPTRSKRKGSDDHEISPGGPSKKVRYDVETEPSDDEGAPDPQYAFPTPRPKPALAASRPGSPVPWR